MAIKWMILIGVIIVLLVLPRAIKYIVYKRLTMYVARQNFEAFNVLLDGFFCTFSYRPFQREYMRLHACFMQNDTTKIHAQLQRMFQLIKMRDLQKTAVAKRGFYFYMEQKKYLDAKKMLIICQKAEKKSGDLHNMEMMYSILAEKKSAHIKELSKRIEELKNIPAINMNNAQLVRMGIFEYLLALQYTYQNNKELAKKYLISALTHCQNTPYVHAIEATLQEGGYQ